MRFRHRIVVLATFACVAVTPVYAQRGNGKGPAAKPVKTTSTKPPKTTAPTPATATPTTTVSPIAAKIQSKPQLASRLEPLLAGTGLTLDKAATGFRNQGQFIAALHVSQNLGIPFKDLKAQMMAPNNKSLGQAIQTFNRTANAGTEVKKAKKQTTTDLSSK